MSLPIVIVGAGRMGAGLGLALAHASHPVTMLTRTPRDLPPTLTQATGDEAWRAALGKAVVVIVATPDAAITTAAAHLHAIGGLPESAIGLHLSGLLEHGALAPLQRAGASMHPLMAISDPRDAIRRLDGTIAAVEGDDEAVRVALALASDCGMRGLVIPSDAKARYHAAASMASNYLVTLLDAAIALAIQAGIEPEHAAEMMLSLAEGTLANVSERGPAAALTGAIRRGDEETVARHLTALDDSQLDSMYRELGRATLTLARRAGLPEARAAAIAKVLNPTSD